MHIHKLEKIWLIFGTVVLAIFLLTLGVGAFSMNMAPPSHKHSVDPQKIRETEPFNEPRIEKIGRNEYHAYMVAYAFGYDPMELEVPAGSTVHFTVTSPDVVHGFAIPGTNVNMMIVPGEISHITHTFDKPGTYLILCNEYCGTGHEYMATKIIVT